MESKLKLNDHQVGADFPLAISFFRLPKEEYEEVFEHKIQAQNNQQRDQLRL